MNVTMLKIQRRDVPAGDAALGPELHPVLRRVYAARGLRAREDLDLSLERLAPVGSLGGAAAAAELMLAETKLVEALLAEGSMESETRAENLREFLGAAQEFDLERAARMLITEP